MYGCVANFALLPLLLFLFIAFVVVVAVAIYYLLLKDNTNKLS